MKQLAARPKDAEWPRKKKPDGSARPSQDEWNFRHLMQILKRRKSVLVGAIAAGIIFAVVFHLVCPRKYESKAQLLVMRKDARLAARGVDAGGDSEVRVTEDLLATHMQMLQSRSLVDNALKEEGLIDLPSIIDNLTDRQKPCDYVIENMSISRGGTGQARSAHVLNIGIRSRSKEDCQSILQAIVKKYQSFLAVKFQDVNQEAASLISQAQTELAQDLEEAEKKYESFREKSTNLMWKAGSETTNVYRVEYEGILQELASLQLSRADAAARLDAVNDRLKNSGADGLTDLEKLSLVDEKNLTRVGLLLMAQKGESDSPDFQAEMPIRLARSKVELEGLSAMKQREQSLLTELGEKHPEVINIRKQIESLEKDLNQQKRDLKSGRSNFALDPKALFESFHQLLQNDILAMDRREARLKALAEDAMQKSSETVTDEIQGDTLRREVQRKQALYDAAVDRLRDINLAKDYGGFINEVLSEPELGLKVMPRLSISLALGILLSLAIGVAGVAIAEYRDRRFRTIADLQNALQLPVMGRIPMNLDRTSKNGKNGVSVKGQPGAAPVTGPQVLDPESPAADAFRMLRTSLIFSAGEEEKHVFCLTSPSPGDGKSSVTANLAVSLGQLGRRVLIIDCDLRRPSQQIFFSADNERGLTTVIKGQLDPIDSIQTTPHKNVWLMTRGEAVPNPAEFLATGEFARLLEALRKEYDHILLDCPPVLAVPDVLTTAALADGVIIVVRAERTTQIQAQSACASLKQAGAELHGLVVNGLKPGSLDEESYGYGYSYGYGDKHSNDTNGESASVEPLGKAEDAIDQPRFVSISQRKRSSDKNP